MGPPFCSVFTFGGAEKRGALRQCLGKVWRKMLLAMYARDIIITDNPRASGLRYAFPLSPMSGAAPTEVSRAEDRRGYMYIGGPHILYGCIGQ
jgi:hypothetical protein